MPWVETAFTPLCDPLLCELRQRWLMADWPKSKSTDGPGDPPDHPMFGEYVHAILEDASTARLARMLDVNQRTCQKWVNGSSEPPPEIVDRVLRQLTLYNARVPRAKLRALVLQLLADDEDGRPGLEKEVVASELACLYEDLTGFKIR